MNALTTTLKQLRLSGLIQTSTSGCKKPPPIA